MDARVLPRTSQVFPLTEAIDNSSCPDRPCMGRYTPIILILVLSIGCAIARVPTPDELGARVQKQTGQTVRVTAGAAELPAGVTAEDGLTQDEAVAIALWNSPRCL